MRYNAKAFLEFLNESKHNVDSIWQMRSDVSYFITEMLHTIGATTLRESAIFEGKIHAFELDGIRFAIVFGNGKNMHRAQAYVFADPAQIDTLFNDKWDIEVELEDAKRVFTLRRRDIKRNLYNDFTNGESVVKSVKAAIQKEDVVARAVQFSWRAKQKLGRVSSKKIVLEDHQEWNNMMGYGCEFSSTPEMMKNGTISFKIPVWAVLNKDLDVRKAYAEKNLDYVGRFVIGRKDSCIRWWDFYTNSSKRMYYSLGDHLHSLKDYMGAFAQLTTIMSRNTEDNDWYQTMISQSRRSNRPSKPHPFSKFYFKDGWDDNKLASSKVTQAIETTLDNLW